MPDMKMACTSARLAAGMVAVLQAGCATPGPAGTDAAGPDGSTRLAGLVRNGRWLAYRGEHPWIAGIDFQSCACKKNFDYLTVLDALQQSGLNKIRIWGYAYFFPDDCQAPWVVTNGVYDLDTWDAAYWERMRAFAAAARARSILVEYTLFAPYPYDVDWWSGAYRQAWNRAFNMNGVFSSNAQGHFYPELYDLAHAERSSSQKSLRDYQEALVDKAISELDEFDNVYFEIANEFGQSTGHGDIHGWQEHFANYLRSRSARLITVHSHDTTTGTNPNGVEYYWDLPSVDILNFHFYSGNPNDVPAALHDAQRKDKVLQSNESFAYFVDQTQLDAATREAWAFFTSGGYYHFFHRDRDFDAFGSAAWRTAIRRLAVVREVAESVRFWEMSPVDAAGSEYDTLVRQGPADGWQVIAHPGSEYVVYFWGAQSTANVLVDLPAGGYSFTWRDARDGAVLASGSANGPNGVIAAPSLADWNASVGVALVIRRNP